ncbi:hypothetical protein JOB18_023349 [Solea senegalensis]|uniref:Uncharacterized protein n=1 Tax=Solea senegalensis TaxID=28829 RepID=A0AAV6R6H7_SOLSE|nr:hypothetical protein JOB18_023349 [Solea senegalensis]
MKLSLEATSSCVKVSVSLNDDEVEKQLKYVSIVLQSVCSTRPYVSSSARTMRGPRWAPPSSVINIVCDEGTSVLDNSGRVRGKESQISQLPSSSAFVLCIKHEDMYTYGRIHKVSKQERKKERKKEILHYSNVPFKTVAFETESERQGEGRKYRATVPPTSLSTYAIRCTQTVAPESSHLEVQR